MTASADPERLALSVVVCSIGGAAPEACVESIAEAVAVTTVRAEVIVVWQAEKPVPAFAGPTRVVSTFPVGLSYARNRGLGEAIGSIVAFVDDDEVVDRQWAQGLLAAFHRPPHPAGVFGAVAPLEDNGFAYCSFDGATDRAFRGGRTPPSYVGTGGNMAFRRKELVAAGGFDPAFGVGSAGQSAEDSEVISRLLRKGLTLVWTPDMRVYHPSKTREERRRSRYPYGYGMGKLVRRYRDPVLAGRYSAQIARALVTSAAKRDGRRQREAFMQLRGFSAGAAVPAHQVSPPRLLERLPAVVGEALVGSRLEPLPARDRPDPHFLYRNRDQLLHLYVHPDPRVERGYAAREAIRGDMLLAGIPATYALERGSDALWVLEERLEGHHPPLRDPDSWFEHVAAWALRLAGRHGPRLARSEGWHERRTSVLEACPPHLRRALLSALDIVEDLPAAHVHGDFSAKNVVVEEQRVGAVDWEDAALEGVPGLDLLFLAVTTGGHATPDGSIVRALAEGRDPSFAPLTRYLDELGVDGKRLRPTLLTILAWWAADETRRLTLLGSVRGRPVYRELLLACAPALVSARRARRLKA